MFWCLPFISFHQLPFAHLLSDKWCIGNVSYLLMKGKLFNWHQAGLMTGIVLAWLLMAWLFKQKKKNCLTFPKLRQTAVRLWQWCMGPPESYWSPLGESTHSQRRTQTHSCPAGVLLLRREQHQLLLKEVTTPERTNVSFYFYRMLSWYIDTVQQNEALFRHVASVLK